MPSVSASSAQGLGAADGLRRAVERGEVTVAGAIDHRAAESFVSSAVISPKRCSTARHRSSPAAAACRRRGDDVGEQHSAQRAM